MKIIPTLLVLTVAASQAAAQAKEDCQNIADADARLACYDSAATESTPIELTDKWIVTDESDPLDDSRVVVLTNIDFEDELGLILRCSNGETNVFIAWGEYLSENRQRVEYRVGSEPMESSMWSVSTSNTATFFPGSQSAEERFASRLVEASKSENPIFVARTTPYNNSPHTGQWDLTGLAKAVLDLELDCAWSGL